MSSVSRRDLLKSAGVLIVGFSFGARGALAQNGKSLDPNEVDSFLTFAADGSVTIYTSKVDVGTGLRIALSQMVAEELGVPVSRVSVVDGDTALTPDHGGTGGSTGIPRGGVEIRRAAATAREAVLRRASKQNIEDVSLAQVIGGKRLLLKVDPQAPLRDPMTYKVVGKPLLRTDVPAKCTGRRQYVHDVKLPGMLHARVVRPPALGAKLLSLDETSISSIPGVRVVRIESFLAVVSADEWAAIRGARELKTTWSEWEGLPGHEGLDRYVRALPIEKDEVTINKGDAVAALADAATKLSATYTWPNQSHASLGPSCAVADVEPDGSVTIWSSSQGTHGIRQTLARQFSIDPVRIRVIFADGAGSYGSNGNDDAAMEAFLLSRTVGQPVRLQWTRQEELGLDPKGPQQLLEMRAAFEKTNDSARITAWEAQMWVPASLPGQRPFVALDAAAISQTRGQNSGLLNQNADTPYATPNVRVVTHWTKTTPLRPSNLRAPGKIANVFASEGFADEIAASAGVDAIAFRLAGLSDPRAVEVIHRTARMIGWKPRPSPNPQPGSGRGFAYARYKQSENYVAVAMEVEVDRSTGKVSLKRVCCAHDGGLIINPDGLRNQVEGNIVQTLSRAMHEETKFDHSRVTSVDWASYPILKFNEVPAVEVELVNHPELPPLGAGEAAAAPVAAALANAIFDASGIRLRSVPFTSERVRVTPSSHD
jgi:CO/xanthine dehydrogenase Mo-binding subunit